MVFRIPYILNTIPTLLHAHPHHPLFSTIFGNIHFTYIYIQYIYINASFPATLRLNIQGVREFFLVPRDGFVAEHGAGSWGEQSHGLALAYPAINGDT
jgi:hypothetical protein